MPSTPDLEILRNPSSNDFFVLDIDSTLVTTYQRNQAILDEFITTKKEQFPEDCLNLKQAQCQLGDYGLKTGLERIKFKETAPGLSQLLQDYWRKNFFSNNFLSADRPAEGAVEWVQYLKTFGVDFIYLTARHKDTMWEGTLSSLKDLGFPISEKNLFLKEDLRDNDEGYKTKLLGQIIAKKKQNIWFIDNEPTVLNEISKDHPKVNLIWFESTHSGKATPPEGITSIKSFIF